VRPAKGKSPSAVRIKNEAFEHVPPQLPWINELTPHVGRSLTPPDIPLACATHWRGCDNAAAGVSCAAAPGHDRKTTLETLVKPKLRSGTSTDLRNPRSGTNLAYLYARRWSSLPGPKALGSRSLGARTTAPRMAMRLAPGRAAAIAAHQNHQARLRNRAGALYHPVRFAESRGSRHPVQRPTRDGSRRRLSPTRGRGYGVDFSSRGRRTDEFLESSPGSGPEKRSYQGKHSLANASIVPNATAWRLRLAYHSMHWQGFTEGKALDSARATATRSFYEDRSADRTSRLE